MEDLLIIEVPEQGEPNVYFTSRDQIKEKAHAGDFGRGSFNRYKSEDQWNKKNPHHHLPLEATKLIVEHGEAVNVWFGDGPSGWHEPDSYGADDEFEWAWELLRRNFKHVTRRKVENNNLAGALKKAIRDWEGEDCPMPHLRKEMLRQLRIKLADYED